MAATARLLGVIVGLAALVDVRAAHGACNPKVATCGCDRDDGCPNMSGSAGPDESGGNGGGFPTESNQGGGAGRPVVHPSLADFKGAPLAPNSSEIKSMVDDNLLHVCVSPGSQSESFDVCIENGTPVATLGYGGEIPTGQSPDNKNSRLVYQQSDPVAADGEAVIEETDVAFSGVGVPYTFTRYYRSGVDYQGSLGYGWNHNLNRRLFKANRRYDQPQGCNQGPPDVFYVSERMDRIRFSYQSTDAAGVDHYRAPVDPGLRLSFNPKSAAVPWTVTNGSGLRYQFDDPNGQLVAVSDFAGHALNVTWDPVAHRVTQVVDTTGRTIYYRYSTHTFYSVADNNRSEPYTYSALDCLSLVNDCRQPLVSFQTRGVVAGGGNRVLNGTYYQAYYHTEWDLAGVTDANGYGPTYQYYQDNRNYYAREFLDYIPDTEIGTICQSLCGRRADDCRNYDLCGLALDQDALDHCVYIGDDGFRCYRYCMATSWDGRESNYSATDATCKLQSQNTEHCQKPPPHPMMPEDFCSPSAPPHYCRDAQSACEQAALTAEQHLPESLTNLCHAACLPNCYTTRAAFDQAGARRYAWGIPPALRHNLLRIIDGDGRVVAHNVYGEDPFSPDFDKVVTNIQNEGDPLTPSTRFASTGQVVAGSVIDRVARFLNLSALASSVFKLPGLGAPPDNVITFEYHDLNVEKTQHVPGASYVTALDQFQATTICPPSGDGYGAATVSNGPNAAEQPAWAVVIRGLRGVVRTHYYDSSWRLLREINHNTQATVDYNYANDVLQARLTQAGDRLCVDSDDQGKPIRTTHYPAPAHPGQATPRTTTFARDANEQLIQTMDEPGSASPAGTVILRDALERVIAVGRQVSLIQTDWTCYEYADKPAPTRSRTGARAPLGQRMFAEATVVSVPSGFERARSLAGQPFMRGVAGTIALALVSAIYPQAWMFIPSGCATRLSQGQAVRASAVRDELPSTIINPDGSMIKQSLLTADGPGDVLVDASGQDPLEFFLNVRYNGAARTIETGERVASTGRVKLGASARQQFDGAGQLVASARRAVDGTWISTRYAYDRSHHRTSVLGPLYRRDLTVDALGNVGVVADAPEAGDLYGTKPRTSCVQRDVAGRVLQAVRPEGNLDQYVYDDDDRLIEVRRGYASLPLDAWASRCKPVVKPIAFGVASMEQVAAFQYDAGGFLVGATTEGIARTFVVDGFGRVIDTLTPDHTETGQVARGGGLTPTTLTLYRHAIQGYDDLGRIAWQGIFDGPTPGYGKPSAPGQSVHAMAELHYDLLDRPTSIDRWRFAESPLQVDPLGPAHTAIAYDDASGTVTTTSPESVVSIRRLDGAGRAVLEVRAAGAPAESVRRYSYAQSGLSLTRRLSPAPTPSGDLIWSYAFDSANRLSNLIEGGRTLLSERYDRLGRLVAQGDLITSRTFEYDAYDRRVFDRLATGSSATATTAYAWDGNDRLSRVVDGASHATARVFDGLDRLSLETNGLGAVSFAYEPGSTRFNRRTDPADSIYTIEYDPSGRPAQATMIDGPLLPTAGAQTTRLFAYTWLGQLATATLKGAPTDMTVALAYDSLGRVVSEQNDSLPLSVTHSYANFVKTTELRQSGAIASQITERYDALGRTLGLGLNGKSVASLDYPQSALAAIHYANQVNSTLSYDAHARPVGVALTAAGGAPLASIADSLGDDDVPRLRRRRLAALPERTDLYETDAAGRVTVENLGVANVPALSGAATNSAVDPLRDLAAPSIGYSLDGAANWIQRTGAGAFTPIIDAANRYTAVGANAVTHDAAGDLQTVGIESYAWNGLSQLTSAAVNGNTETLTYDALGRRVRERQGQSSTFLIWDGSTLLAFGPDGDVNSARLRIALGADQTLALVDQRGTGAAAYLHPGTDGSTFASTDSTGALIEGYSYSAYGETTFIDPGSGAVSTSKIGNRFLYQGQLYDPALDLYSMRAREYKPAWGRFLSPDPIGLSGGLNLYAFVAARPLLFSDPTGLSGRSDRALNPTTFGLPYVVDPNILTDPVKVAAARAEFARASQAAQDRLIIPPNFFSHRPGGDQTDFQMAASLYVGMVIATATPYLSQTLEEVAAAETMTMSGETGMMERAEAAALNVEGTAEGAPRTGARLGSGLGDDALVCRGGTCTANRFANGSGVTLDAEGKLQGVSVNSAPNATVQELTSTLRYNQVGVTTVGDIRAIGGSVIPSPTVNNPYHCTLCSITADQAEQLFTPTIPNPNR